MIRPHILDTLAQKQDCYISDLRLNPVNNQAALADLLLLDNSVCPLNDGGKRLIILSERICL